VALVRDHSPLEARVNRSTIDTQFGPFTAVVDDDGAVLASGWTTDLGELLPLIHPQLRSVSDAEFRPDLGAVTRAVRAYHAGEMHAIDDVVVRQHSGGVFLTAAWKTLREVEPGSPVTYTELAARTGNPAANRAAAQACARNAAALFVPCHRVVRVGGSVGGFRWGPEIKRQLLAHEAAAIGN
jgi:methylated-DNA-[protein]-cysteine S-methyltransferase